MSTGQQAVNQTHPKTRAQAGQANATLTPRRLLHKPRRSTTHTTTLAQAVPTQHPPSSQRR
ncbi:hypothetical protein [Streptomyces sp. NPDC051909]|uniref:hypothetical protein n=1 Tax=Streptomyces sp. NPDC051909 TaxID=3154944 RepID=UPI003442B7D8